MKTRAWTVFLKELRDSARDRRTALMVFVGSIVMGPVTLILLAQFVAGLEEKARVLKVRMTGQEHAAAIVNFFQRNDVEIESAPADYEQKIREGRLDAVIVVPDDFEERFNAGDAARVEIVYDDSRSEAGPAIRQAERLLRAFNHETGMLRLIARGVSPDLGEPVKIEHSNTATPRQKGALLLFLIPMFAILSPILGGMAVAIDTTAGERERGSLEPLLANPVRIEDLVVGKWLCAWLFASLVGFLTLAGMVAAASFYAESRLGALMSFGVAELILFMLMLVPFAAMTSALQMLICTYGRSYREAQTYVSYLTAVVSFVPLIVFFAGMKDAMWELAVPALGQQLVFSRIIRGDPLGPADWAVPTGTSLAIGAVCVVLLARLLRDERIVFGRS